MNSSGAGPSPLRRGVILLHARNATARASIFFQWNLYYSPKLQAAADCRAGSETWRPRRSELALGRIAGAAGDLPGRCRFCLQAVPKESTWRSGGFDATCLFQGENVVVTSPARGHGQPPGHLLSAVQDAHCWSPHAPWCSSSASKSEVISLCTLWPSMIKLNWHKYKHFC